MLIAGAAQFGLAGPGRLRRACVAALLLVAMLGPAIDGIGYLQDKKFPHWRDSARMVVAWPACRTAPIVTSGGWNSIGYYIRRFAPEARVELHEWGKMDSAADYRNIKLAPDCPVLWWGVGSGVSPRLRSLIRDRHGPFRVVRFYRVFVVVRAGTELPRGFADAEGVDID
jgi:hypothetical protein